MGLHRLDQKQTVLQVPFNIALSVVLAIYMGIDGIIIGTIVSIFFFSTIYKGRYIYEFVFEKDARSYYVKTALDCLRTGVCFAVIYLIGAAFPAVGLLPFVVKAVVLLPVIPCMIALAFATDRDFRFSVGVMRNKFMHKKNG